MGNAWCTPRALRPTLCRLNACGAEDLVCKVQSTQAPSKYRCPISNLVCVHAQEAQTATMKDSSNRKLMYRSSFLSTRAGAMSGI